MSSGGNIAGLLIIAGAAGIIIMGIKGSQHKLFPGLFGNTATSGVDTSTGEGIIQSVTHPIPAPVAGPSTVKPGTNNSCPHGYLYNPQTQLCVKLLPLGF